MKRVLFSTILLLMLFISSFAQGATTYYEVWRNTTNNSSTATRIAAWLDTNSYDDSDPALVPGQQYYYWVKVITAETVSAYWNDIFRGDGIFYVYMTCPTATSIGIASPIKVRFRVESNIAQTITQLTNSLMEQDVFFDDTMEQWSENFNVPLFGNDIWQKEWTHDIVVSDFENGSIAEVYAQTSIDYIVGLDTPANHTMTCGYSVNVSLRDYFDSGPTDVNASGGTFTDKVHVSWDAATGNSDFSTVAVGFTQAPIPPNPDVTGDGKVDFFDYAVLANQWLVTGCNETNNWCNKADIDKSGEVDYADLLIMAQHWLEVNSIGMVWVSINDPGIGGGHEGFNGQMSKYETTNAQYCQFLKAALASGDITFSGNNVVGASGSNSGADFVGQVYYNLAGSGYTYNGATNGGAARIHYSGGVFSVDSGFENHPVTYVSWYGATAFCNYYGYRLPTEWAWQAVADYYGSYTYGCGTTINNSIANYNGSFHPNGTTVVGSVGNPSGYGYGMCDMAGNVCEWTSSIYNGSYGFFRGGGWHNFDNLCSVLNRNYFGLDNSSYSLGFRVYR